jgi:flavorubredoxin
MNMSIYPIPLGFDQAYIIQGEGVVMIDGGAPKKAKAFIKGIKKL